MTTVTVGYSHLWAIVGARLQMTVLLALGLWVATITDGAWLAIVLSFHKRSVFHCCATPVQAVSQPEHGISLTHRCVSSEYTGALHGNGL
jgi:hypothetical protein